MPGVTTCWIVIKCTRKLGFLFYFSSVKIVGMGNVWLLVSSEIESSPVGGEGENDLAAVPSLSGTRDWFQGRLEGGMVSGCFLEVGDP